ncbi:MAG: phage tail protein [Cyanobacteria bacterium J06638_28]
MADGEVLAGSKYYAEIDGYPDLIVKKVSGIGITLETAGDMQSFGVTKDGKSQIQATVTGITQGTLTIEFVATVEDDRLVQWYRDSHSSPISGGGTNTKGERKNASISLYNQGGTEAARWEYQGLMPKTYTSSKLEPGSTELYTETVEFAYEYFQRVS